MVATLFTLLCGIVIASGKPTLVAIYDNAINADHSIHATHCENAKYALFANTAEFSFNSATADRSFMTAKADLASKATEATFATNAVFSPHVKEWIKSEPICKDNKDKASEERIAEYFKIKMVAAYKLPCGSKKDGLNGKPCKNGGDVMKARISGNAKNCDYAIYATKAKYAANSKVAYMAQHAESAKYAEFAQFAKKATFANSADKADSAKC